jgi:DMSO/TMAO reductase YedYZ molybdopterin-dependent catalytic subunit
VKPTRRDALIALGLVACDTRRPKRGLLGASERVNEKIEGVLMHDVDPSPRDVTPERAYPSYHVAPAVPLTPSDWVLEVNGKVGTPLRLSVDDLKRLPITTKRIHHYCVEGWSAVAEWTGVRVSEIAKLAGAKDTDYVEFRSFDAPTIASRGYWSSWDRESAMHGHTLLAFGMNGKPLTPAYGAPVRLFGAVKLGYKNVKYLTEVNFLDRRTGGYWEDKGYEWFAGV